MDDLKAKLAALEDRLITRLGETCPKCGEHAMRLDDSGRVMGSPPNQHRRDGWKCANCGHAEERMVSFK
jgi:ribosomal protein S27AE